MMGPSGLAGGKKRWESGAEPTGVTVLAHRGVRRLLCETTARVHCILQPFWQSVALDRGPRLADVQCGSEDGLQIPAFARPEKTRLTDTPRLSPTRNVFVRCKPQDTVKCDYAAKSPASKKRKAHTGCLLEACVCLSFLCQL